MAIWCNDDKKKKKPLQPFSDLVSHSSRKHLRPVTWLITKAPLAMQRLGDVYRDRNPTWVDCESQGRGDVARKSVRAWRTDFEAAMRDIYSPNHKGSRVRSPPQTRRSRSGAQFFFGFCSSSRSSDRVICCLQRTECSRLVAD